MKMPSKTTSPRPRLGNPIKHRVFRGGHESYPYNELMILLSGRVEIEDLEGSVVTLEPGDAFIMHKGFAGTWRQLEPMVKYYLIYS